MSNDMEGTRGVGDEPAFPLINSIPPGEWRHGLTIRDYLAGHALNGYLSTFCRAPTKEQAQQLWAWVDTMLATRDERDKDPEEGQRALLEECRGWLNLGLNGSWYEKGMPGVVDLIERIDKALAES